VVGNKINSMEKEFIYFKMVKDMMVKLTWDINKDKDHIFTIMVIYTLVNGLEMLNKDGVCLNIKLQKKNTKEIFMKVKDMVKVLIIMHQEICNSFL